MNFLTRLFLLVALLRAGALWAQPNITQAEYFFDTDPGFGNGIPINITSPSPNVVLNFTPNIAGLSDGFHNLYVRGKDANGFWSLVQARTFLKLAAPTSPTISSFNPTSGLVGSSVVITGTNFSPLLANNTVRFNGVQATVTNASATSLTVTVPPGATTGLITVTVGGLNGNSGSNFTVILPNITALEYFFNTDPGPGNGTPISMAPGTTLDLNNINIPTTSLPVGWHLLCVRARDANNVLGFYECRRIYVREPPPPIQPNLVEDITALEFYYNTDNGPGTGTVIPITPGATVDVLNANLANSLPIGWHTISVRAKNATNVWGFPETRRIYVREPPQPCCEPPSPIVALEWFVDTDPGVGQGTFSKTITPPEPGILDRPDEPLDVGTLPTGARKIGLRAKNAAGQWSMTETRDFTVTVPCSIIDAPTATGPVLCAPGAVTLTASGAVTGETYRWYANETTLTSLFTGNPYITPTLSVNTTYYVTRYNATTFCESSRFAVTARVEGLTAPVLNLSGSLEVCEGNSVSLIHSGGFSSYTWRRGAVDLGQNVFQITVNQSGVYTLVVSNGTCTSPASLPVTLTVNPKPVKPIITATDGGSLCADGTVALTAPASEQYLWSGGQTTPSINVTTVSSHTVRVTSAAGCQSDLSDPFNVISLPPDKPVITITGNPVLCGSSSVQLSVPDTFTSYTWRNGATVVGTTAPITVNSAGNYTVVVNNGTCASVASDGVAVTSVTVPPAPTITNLGVSSLCTGSGAGSFTILRAPNGFANYLWSNLATTQEIIVNAPGTFTVQVGNSANCLSVASSVVSITSSGETCVIGTIPAPTATSASRCDTGTVGLSASGATGSQVYRWYAALTGGSVLFTGANYTTPSITTTTNYYVAIFDPAVPGESTRVPATATLVSFATPVLTGPSTVTICSGTSTTLTAPAGFTNYSWSTTAPTQQLSVTAAGSYTVRVGDGTCFSNPSNAITVNVTGPLAAPTISVTSGNANICGSGSVTLTAPAGFASYTWSGGATSPSITTSIAGSYSVIVSDGICTSASSNSIAITVSTIPAKPSVAVTGSTALCPGGFVLLSAPAGFSNYLWSNGATERLIEVTTPGNYTVQVGNNANCRSVDSDGVSVTNSASCGPIAGPTVASQSQCAPGGTFTYLASGATGSQVYRWYDAPTGGSLLFTGNPFTPSVSTTTTYHVAIFDPGPVTETPRTAFSATVVNIATPSITPSSATICEGSVSILSAPTGFLRYLWSNNAETQQVAINATSTLTLQVGDAACLSSASAPVTVTVSPALAKPVITPSGSTTFCGSGTVTLEAPTGFSLYQWSTGASTQTIPVSTAGNYTVTVGNGICTSPASDAINVNVVTVPAKPTVSITGNTALCNGAFVSLTAPVASHYLWSTGATDRTILVTTAGSYRVRIGNTLSCLSVESDNVTITETGVACGGAATPEANFVATTVCAGNSTSFSDLSINLGTSPAYAWDFDGDGNTDSPAVGNTSFTYPAAGTYNARLSITLAGGSVVSRTGTVTVNAVPQVSIAVATACVGTATAFTDNSVTLPASTYSWDFENDGVENSNVKGSTSYAYPAGGVYTARLSVNNGNGCSNQQLISVAVTRAPVAPLIEIEGGASPQLCGSSSIKLIVPPEVGATFSWSRNGSAAGTNANELAVANAGTYRVTVSNQCGPALSINAVTTVVVPVPTASAITTTGPTALCQGETSLLSVPFTTGVQYQWKKDGTALAQATTNLYLATDGGTYQVTFSNACGSESSPEFSLTTLPSAPTAPTISASGSTTLCPGAQLDLSVPSLTGVTFVWKRNNVDLGLNQSSITVSESGFYTLEVRNQCRTISALNQIQVASSQLPLAQFINADRSPTICPGERVLLGVTPETGITYQWQRNNTNIAAAQSNQYTATETGAYKLILQNNCGSIESSNAIGVTVTAPPAAPIISVTGNTSICQDETSVLQVTSLQGASYSWIRNDTAIPFTNSNTLVVSQAGIYKVEINNGCSAVASSNQITIELKPQAPVAQTIVSSADPVFCAPNQIELRVPIEAGVTYLWKRNGQSVGTNSNLLTVSTSGVYRLEISNECRTVPSLNEIAVAVLQLPRDQNIQTDRPPELCDGESVALSVPSETDVDYQWQRDGVDVPFETGSRLNTSQAGDYRVRLTNRCGEKFSAVLRVNVQLPPASVNINANGPLSFCEGGSVVLSVPLTTGQNYRWRRDDAVISSGTQVLADRSATYSVQIGNLCFPDHTRKSVLVTEFENPAPPTILANLQDACDKRTYVLRAQGNFVAYQWFFGNSRVVANNTAIYNPVTTGAYKVRAKDVNGCEADSEPFAVNVSSPRAPIIIGLGSPDSLLTTNVAASKFQWFVDNRYIVNATARDLPVFYNGEYKVQVTFEDGCKVFSAAYRVNEDDYQKFGRLALFPNDSSIVLPERKFNDVVELSPNPAQNRITVNYFGSATEGTTCTLFHGSGLKVMAAEMQKSGGYMQIVFDVTHLEPGIYLVQVRNPFVILTRKLIKI